MRPFLRQTKVYLPDDLTRELEAFAARTRRSKSEAIRTAVDALLARAAADQAEAALGPGLDLLEQHLERLEQGLERVEGELRLCREVLALHVLNWLTATPPMLPQDREAAEARGRERYRSFVAALGRRLQAGGSLWREIPAAQDDGAGGDERPQP